MCHAAGEAAPRDVVSGCGWIWGSLRSFSNLNDFESRMGENEEASEMQPLSQVEPRGKGLVCTDVGPHAGGRRVAGCLILKASPAFKGNSHVEERYSPTSLKRMEENRD